MVNHLGELVALLTAICWTATGLAFQQATRMAGSLSVNIIRLIMALVLYAVISKITRGLALPVDAGLHQWLWLSVSGLVGFVFGDYFLFKSYEYVSARISMLIMALSPPIASLISWGLLGERLGIQSLIAMAVTLSGIVLVVMQKRQPGKNNTKKYGLSFSGKGIAFAFLGAVGQAAGLVLSKFGMGDYNVFAATQIRVIAGSVGFVILISIIKRWPRVKQAVVQKKAMMFMIVGAVFGPLLGVYFSLLAVKHTSVGIASTIMSIMPVLIIPPAVMFFGEKVTFKEVVGAVITVGGVALFFI